MQQLKLMEPYLSALLFFLDNIQVFCILFQQVCDTIVTIKTV